jgi:type IV pilus assembly protein PilF
LQTPSQLRPTAGALLALGATLGLLALACASAPRRDPDQSFIRYQLGVEYFKSQRLEAAVEELEKALAADPENADAHNMLGLIALRQGHDYVAQGETSACLSGRDAELVRQDATRRFRQAEEHFRRAVAYRREFPGAWNNLAVAALQLEEWPAAVTAASEALKDSTYTEPEFARANLGWAYLQMKDTQKAWKELHEAVARAPTFCVARYRLAKVYFERGDMEQAAEQIDPVVEDARCPIQEAFMLGGLVHQRRKGRERARALFNRCADLAPRSCAAAQCRRYAQLIR